MSAPHTEWVPGPSGPLEVLQTGAGTPSTVCGHGLAGSIPTTRPYVARVPGRRTLLHFRGHGRSPAPDADWTYAALAAELWTVADHVGATQALGVSMGAGALCAGLAADPGRFERAVLVLPATLDRPRDDAAMRRFGALAVLVRAGDADGVADHLVAEQPVAVRDDPGVRTWCRQQAARLVDSAVARALEEVPHQVPVVDATALEAVSAEVLVLAQEDDPAHPVSAARQVAEALPRSHLTVLPAGGIMWAHRDRIRAVIGEFLTAPVAPGPPGES